MSKTNSYVTVGRITRPHGIRGELCAQYYAESYSYLENNQALIKTEHSAPKPFSISSWREQGSLLILKLQGVNTRTEAEFLRNHDIVIDASVLAYDDLEGQNGDLQGDTEALFHENVETSAPSRDASPDTSPDGQAPYLHHILGCTAILADNDKHSATDEAREKQGTPEFIIGVIEEIVFPAGQELWVIKNDKDQEVLFPAVSEFVVRYDLDHQKVYLNPPEGLLDLYLSEDTQNKPKKVKRSPQNTHKNKSQWDEGKKRDKLTQKN